ncbi:Hypothetical predicted protein [Olea europaea subsp. europaea]|uniref:Uncharacterized protein n=1 Tax=Olea europaea subsp. europaea TaxID=158383 RepID=A0A8S0RXL7_OLEEU|nr:Hypothetical predicted protein [Olea europaea subsp. europaea]
MAGGEAYCDGDGGSDGVEMAATVGWCDDGGCGMLAVLDSISWWCLGGGGCDVGFGGCCGSGCHFYYDSDFGSILRCRHSGGEVVVAMDDKRSRKFGSDLWS